MATREQAGGRPGARRAGIGARLGRLRDAFRRPSEEDLPEGVFLHRTAGFGGIGWRDFFQRPSEKDLPEGVFLHRTAGFGGIGWRNFFQRPSEKDLPEDVALRGGDGRKGVTPRRR